MRPDLVDVLRTMPPAGIRLSGGLALRLTSGNGMHVLGCSRIRVTPSKTEMEVLVRAVANVFQPEFILMGGAAEPLISGGCTHYVWRIYWPAERVQLAWQRPVQAALALGEEE